MFSDVGVNSTERVIQEVDITVLIHSPGKTHSLLLSSTQVDALLNFNDTNYNACELQPSGIGKNLSQSCLATLAGLEVNNLYTSYIYMYVMV